MPQYKESEPKGEFLTEVMLSCTAQGCTNRGKDVFVDFRGMKDELLLYVHHHGNPICGHMWKQAKEDIDHEIEDFKEQAQLKWCPQCTKRIPKSSNVCPECGASL